MEIECLGNNKNIYLWGVKIKRKQRKTNKSILNEKNQHLYFGTI